MAVLHSGGRLWGAGCGRDWLIERVVNVDLDLFGFCPRHVVLALLPGSTVLVAEQHCHWRFVGRVPILISKSRRILVLGFPEILTFGMDCGCLLSTGMGQPDTPPHVRQLLFDRR